MPAYLLSKLRKLLASLSPSSQDIDKIFIEKHGLGEFFYRMDDLNIALDLLAICTDDAVVLGGARQKLRIV